MPNTITLDSLLAGDEPHASFHDASLLRVAVDYEQSAWVGTFAIVVGDPAGRTAGERDATRLAEVSVTGLSLWALEAGAVPPAGLWLTADGPLVNAPTESGLASAQSVASSPVAWFLYFSNTNSFGYLAGAQASFRWL